MRRARNIIGCAVVLMVVATGCRGGDAPPALSIIDLGRDAGSGIAEVDPARRDVLPAAALRLTVEQLLAAHGVSATAMMRSVATDAGDVTRRLDALAGNTADLTAAIGLVYGRVGARAFDQLWSQHTQAFLDYAAAGSDKARATARAHLVDYEHDFASFCGNPRMKKSTVRLVDSITVVRQRDRVVFTFHGTGFLQNMVRILVGTLLEVGRGARQPEDMPALLEARDRRLAGPTAPPEGLCLMKVDY